VLTAFRYRLTVHATGLGGEANAAAPSERVTVVTTGAVAGEAHQSLTNVDVGFGSIRSERIAIGSRSWTRDGEGQWVEVRSGAVDSPFTLGIDPSALAAAGASGRLAAMLAPLRGVPDDIGGPEVIRYELPAGLAQGLLGAGERGVASALAVTLWVDASGFPVRLLLTGTTEQGVRADAELAIDDHNAEDIVIGPPL
jgi:hypothetical protein